MREFTIKDRGELLEYARGQEIIHFDLTWSLHCRVYVDAELRSSTRTISGAERLEMLREVVAYLRRKTRHLIEVVGERSLGDDVAYTPTSLAEVLRSDDPFTRNSAIHELRGVGGAAVPLWYRVLACDPDALCVSSAFGLLLEHARLRDMDYREILFRLSQSTPGSAPRSSALDELTQIVSQKAPETFALIEHS